MRAMLLAAGLGTRLRPLTDERPKPVLPVGGRPLAWYPLDHLSRSGVREVVVNMHHLPDVLRRELEPWVPPGLHVSWIHEPEILGTGGGLRNAWPLLRDRDEPVLVVNSDMLFAFDVAALRALHERSGAVATMVLREDPDAARWGAIEIDRDGRVRRLLGAPGSGEGLRALMFTGAYLLAPRAGDALPERGCVIRSAFRRWVDGGEVVMGRVETAGWRDVGTPEAYEGVNADLAAGRLRWPPPG